MTSEPIADSMSPEGWLVKYLQASRLVATRELIPVNSIARNNSRTNAYKGNFRGTKNSGRDRFQRC